MKTPMQKHIDDLIQAKQIIKALAGSSSAVSAFESSIENARHYLKEEKEIIIKSYESGANSYDEYNQESSIKRESKDYFSETFKND